tara:strand:+ start:892 stop:1272 length:381 start_codon:yes stop_codon:yes gene_type:complete
MLKTCTNCEKFITPIESVNNLLHMSNTDGIYYKDKLPKDHLSQGWHEFCDECVNEPNLLEYSFTVSTNNIWTSFDFGTVFAHNITDAKEMAVKKLRSDFDKANQALSLLGMTMEFNADAVQIEVKK